MPAIVDVETGFDRVGARSTKDLPQLIQGSPGPAALASAVG